MEPTKIMCSLLAERHLVKSWEGSALGAIPSFRFPQKEERNFGIATSGYFF
jgi:hypothetical protein